MTNELIVDWHSLQQQLREQGLLLDPRTIARALAQLARAIGGTPLRNAVIAIQDQAAITAFELEGFRVWKITGSRSQVLDELKSEVVDRLLDDPEQPVSLTLVTTDVAFQSLVRMVKRQRHSQVRVWGPSNGTPHALRQADSGFQPLEELMLELKIRSVAILIDWENIWISLTRAGLVASPERIIEVFKQRASRYGKVQVIYACADWDALRESGQGVQRKLEMLDVKTLYEVSMSGKSSSDMRLVDQAHALLRSVDAPDVLVLATGDRDFRVLIKTAREEFGKYVAVWGKKGTTSWMVSGVADEVEWVDDFLNLPRQQDLGTIRDNASPAGATQIDSLTELALRFEAQQRVHRLSWLSPGRLIDTLAPGQVDTEARTTARSLLSRAKAEGVLISQQRPNPRPDAIQTTVEALSLNPAHPSVKAARLLAERVHYQMRQALDVRRMPFAAFSYIATELGQDTELTQAGLARTRPEQLHWLNVMVESGLLVKERRTTPYNCTTLRLPQEQPASTATDDLETMVRRIITSADTWMAQRGLDWVGLKWLHKRLGPCGNAVFLDAVDRLTRTGEAEQRHHENPHGPHPVLGLHLDPQGTTVVTVRQERERILVALRETEPDQPFPVERLRVALGEAPLPDQHTRWSQVLTDEGILQRQDASFCLNRNHVLVRGRMEPEVRVGPATPTTGARSQTRRTITDALSDDEVTTLAFDHYPAVYEQFAEGMTKARKVHLLLEHVERRGQVPRLLEQVGQITSTNGA